MTTRLSTRPVLPPVMVPGARRSPRQTKPQPVRFNSRPWLSPAQRAPRSPSTMIVAAPPASITDRLDSNNRIQFWVNNLAQFSVDPLLINLAFTADPTTLSLEQGTMLTQYYQAKVLDYNALEYYGDACYEVVMLDYLNKHHSQLFHRYIDISHAIDLLRANATLADIAKHSGISDNSDVMEALLGCLYFSNLSLTQIYIWFFSLSDSKDVFNYHINRYQTGQIKIEGLTDTYQVGRPNYIPHNHPSQRAQAINYYYRDPERIDRLFNLTTYFGDINLVVVMELLNSTEGALEFRNKATGRFDLIPYDVVGLLGRSYKKLIIADRLWQEYGLRGSANQLSKRSRDFQRSFTIAVMQRLGLCPSDKPEEDPVHCLATINRLLGLLYLLYGSDQHQIISQWLFSLPEVVAVI